ncbi:MAG: zinc ribbon domain-containing protein [Proteobacteria bacterium]|nr:zinc ribbon domain-containing protein [Pseudomonadota bacterium]
MPTYEYKCEDCGYMFEKFQSMKDKPIAKCPKCDGTVRRLISGGAAVIFKGSGFYATDYSQNTSPACGRERPCCGRDTPCDKKPCES